MITIGVLALQGGYAEHAAMLRALGVQDRQVRRPQDVEGLDGLIIPGGESTTIGKLAAAYTLIEPIRDIARRGVPIWGTCAGMILLARDIGGLEQPTIGLLDVVVQRNGFGRQMNSFEVDLVVPALDGDDAGPDSGRPFRAVFIRAPRVETVGKRVEVLATLADGTVVAVRQKTVLATAFHPELTEDTRFHRYFLRSVCSQEGEIVTGQI
jgi:5'-phosphate synthase pdxT subunit